MFQRVLFASLFAFILVSLLAFNAWASFQQPVWEWGGLTNPKDRWWTIATLIDAYYGFLTFFVWVWWKESRWSSRAAWFAAIMLLGNIAMAGYVLLQLARLRPGDRMSSILTSRVVPPARAGA